ncbi:MAG: peptidoglycan-binding protein [Acidimicrobiia bacterium]|nr:peptidoglycan-binding protein [Acidimicrobiia bacterium]
MRTPQGLRLRVAGITALLMLAWLAAPVGIGSGTGAGATEPRYAYGQPVEYALIFPVGGEDIYFADDAVLGFGACRDGCARRHEGVDILAPKMTPVYAAADATVYWLGSSCCSVGLQHDDGWRTWYIHLNNDTVGTDDGLGWGIVEGIIPGARVTAGQLIGWVGDSGNAEDTTPHLHFELHAPGGIKVDPYPALFQAQTGVACALQRPAPLESLLAAGPVLSRGSSGEAVLQLQGFLKTRGYRVGALDGIFGGATEGAVRAFQQKAGLQVDGLVGSATRAAVAAAAAQPGFAALVDLGGRLLKPESKGTDVKELKRWLRAAGYDPGPQPYTSRFDPATLAAVQAFQTAQGLTPDGMVGPMTREALRTALALVGPETCVVPG